jgi:GNAT superfamily N-acetyltransferase
LGEGARARSEALIAVWERLAVPVPQYHLNMLGVRRTRAGQGLGRRLLNAMHEMSRRDATSTGVSLSTEEPKNVFLYQHCGYEIRSHERVTDDMETRVMFRADDALGGGSIGADLDRATRTPKAPNSQRKRQIRRVPGR